MLVFVCKVHSRNEGLVVVGHGTCEESDGVGGPSRCWGSYVDVLCNWF